MAGVSALTRGYAPGAAPPPAARPETVLGRMQAVVRGPYPTIAYWDPNRVRIAVRRKS